jgi:dihydrofolate reductase
MRVEVVGVARLVYSVIASLDGYVAGPDGRFDWAEPDREVHAFVNEQERRIGTYLYGRRMYETMRVWETDPSLASSGAEPGDYARIWQAADKVVYSATLTAPDTRRTRLERVFDPEQVRRLKDHAETDLSLGGPTLAAAALRAGLVDELQVYQVPVVVGGGLAWLPEGLALPLELTGLHRFGNGTVHRSYAVLT